MILLVAFMSRQNRSGGGYVSILARQATRRVARTLKEDEAHRKVDKAHQEAWQCHVAANPGYQHQPAKCDLAYSKDHEHRSVHDRLARLPQTDNPEQQYIEGDEAVI